MRLFRGPRAAAVLAALSLAGVLSACSSGHSEATGPTGTQVATVVPTATAVPTLDTVPSPVPVPITKVLARLSASQISDYRVIRGSTEADRRFAKGRAALLDPTGGWVGYDHVTRAGRTVADVEVVSVPAPNAALVSYQEQTIDSLVTSASGAGQVRYDRVAGRLFAVSGTSPIAVATFRGKTPVLVLGRPGADLTAVSGAAYAFLRH